ncbi:MAG: hypothetical protein AAF621_06370 [Pseudomonadota bacterium]
MHLLLVQIIQKQQNDLFKQISQNAKPSNIKEANAETFLDNIVELFVNAKKLEILKSFNKKHLPKKGGKHFRL